MELTAVAAAVWFAALSPQGVERAGEERFSCEALFQELRELLLDRSSWERSELSCWFMDGVPGQSVGHYQYIPTDSEECLRCGRKKGEKVIPSGEGVGREPGASYD